MPPRSGAGPGLAAIALNPNYAFAHDQFGIGLALQGRLDEALRQTEAILRAFPEAIAPAGVDLSSG